MSTLSYIDMKHTFYYQKILWSKFVTKEGKTVIPTGCEKFCKAL